MDIAFIGPGKMGLNMVARIQSFAETMLADLRNAFGGHAVKR